MFINKSFDHFDSSWCCCGAVRSDFFRQLRDDFRRIQVQRAAQSRVALHSLQMDVATLARIMMDGSFAIRVTWFSLGGDIRGKKKTTFALTMSEKSWTHNLTKSRDDLDNQDVCWILLIIFQGCPWHGTDGPDEYPAGCWGQWHHTALGTSKRRLATTFQVQDPMAGFLWFPMVSNQILVEQWPQWPMQPLLMCLDCTKFSTWSGGLTTFFPGIGYLLLTRLYIISWPMASSLFFLPWPHYPKTLAGVPKLRHIPSPRAMNTGVNHA